MQGVRPRPRGSRNRMALAGCLVDGVKRTGGGHFMACPLCPIYVPFRLMRFGRFVAPLPGDVVGALLGRFALGFGRNGTV